MKKTGLNGYVFDFSVDYDAIATDVLDIVILWYFRHSQLFNEKEWHCKKCCFTGLAFLSTLTSKNLMSCISMNNQECKVRPQMLILMGWTFTFSF